MKVNFALRELVGADNFYTGIAQGELDRLQLALSVLRDGGIHTPALREIESYDAVLVLGEDVTQTGARVALAVRQAVKGKAREMAAAQKVADWQIAAIPISASVLSIRYSLPTSITPVWTISPLGPIVHRLKIRRV